MSDETPEAQRLSDFAWLRATNGGEAQGYPPIVRRLLAAYDEQAAALDDLKQRGPYNQGWLDGAEHTTKTYAGWNERDKTLNAAVDKLKAALDQSDRVRALESKLGEARGLLIRSRNVQAWLAERDEWLAANPDPTPIEARPQRERNGESVEYHADGPVPAETLTVVQQEYRRLQKERR